MIVAMIFCITLLVSIFAAHLYGVFFLKPPDPNTASGKVQLSAKPWYMHSFTWAVRGRRLRPGRRLDRRCRAAATTPPPPQQPTAAESRFRPTPSFREHKNEHSKSSRPSSTACSS